MSGTWYNLIFEVIDLRSFSNLWFWIALAVMWSSVSHWVLGVPVDMIARARRHGGQVQEDLEALARINARRMLDIVATSGPWLVAIVSFILTVLAVLAFGYGVEFAQAVLLLFLPLTLVGLLSLRTARKIMAADERGADLDRRLMRHRMAVQFLGMISILVTSMYGMWVNLMLGVLR